LIHASSEDCCSDENLMQFGGKPWHDGTHIFIRISFHIVLLNISHFYWQLNNAWLIIEKLMEINSYYHILNIRNLQDLIIWCLEKIIFILKLWLCIYIKYFLMKNVICYMYIFLFLCRHFFTVITSLSFI